MTATVRLGLAARAFFLAMVLGLALIFAEPRVFQGILFLCAIAAIATGAQHLIIGIDRWILMLEGLLAALVIAVTLPEGAMLLPFLIVPPLLAGVVDGARAVILVAGIQVLGLLLVLLAGASATTMDLGIQLAAPWAVASLGAGLTGTWVVALRGGPSDTDDAAYASARRLLSQLRTVTRRLSSGLDHVVIADQILTLAEETLGSSRAGLFSIGDGAMLAPVAFRGVEARQSLIADGQLVGLCLKTSRPETGPQPSGLAERRHRTVLPLRSAGRLLGVVIADSPVAPDEETMAELMSALDELSLRLDTALVFDEVRGYATVEERQRLAREIHDGVAQEIASLGYLVDDLQAEIVTESQRRKLMSLRSEITRVVNELRLSIFDLRSEVSPSAGLGSALSDYVRTVGARSGMKVHLTLDEASSRLRQEVETEMLRIAQEAVTNARKHSEAKNLWVDCRVRPPFAQVSIEDDGVGVGPGRVDSYGLKIMRERADRIGASLSISSDARLRGPRGTTVTVAIGDSGDPAEGAMNGYE